MRESDEPIARLHAPLPTLVGLDYPAEIRADQFLAQVQALAEQLPAQAHVVNLCDNRYLFMLSFCAALLRGVTNLLPPNRNPATQCDLAERYAPVVVIHDGVTVADGLAAIDLRQVRLDGRARSAQVPTIDLAQLAAITFTSGSTGQSQANPKTWHTFVASTALNRRYMLPPGERLQHLLATVPGQHMWGLETSVLLALMAPVCVSDLRPLFPADVARTLAALPLPRLLVSTPVHLRALSLSGVVFPPVLRILCATAPLSQSLAGEVERCLTGELTEIFGCSEVGSMACRATARERAWRPFSGLDWAPGEDSTCVSAPHLPAPVQLNDHLAFAADGRFHLLGRESDVIEMAGKRGSLGELNKILQEVPGVIDGVVFVPEVEGDRVRRLVALVVAQAGLNKADIVAAFRRELDPVFVPRPIRFVSRLPREENGKLPRATLLAFYAELAAGGDSAVP